MEPLKVSIVKKSEGVFVISSIGSIDGDTYEILQAKVDSVLNPSPKTLVFDLQGVVYMSSMGLKVLLRTKELVEKAGGSVLLINLQPQISKLFDIIKAIPSHNIFSSVAELDQYLAAIQRKEIEKRRPA